LNRKEKMKKNETSLETTLVHSGIFPDKYNGMINPPVHRASTIIFNSIEDMKNAKFIYGRSGTPTSKEFEDAMTASMPGAFASVSTCSGLSAINVILLGITKPGDHILVMDNVYGHTKTVCEGVLKKTGVEFEYYPPMIGGDIKNLIKDNTVAIFLEAPGSLTFEICDIGAIVNAAKSRNIKTIIDNTWATPVFFNPFEHGFDISVISASKYIAGHSDAMLGVITATEETYPLIKDMAMRLGICAGTEELYLGLRGLRTLSARLKEHEAKAMELAQWLEKRPEVKTLLHPAFASCKGNSNWQKYFKGSSGTFGIILKETDEKKIAKMVESFKLFHLGLSWGGFESLCAISQPVRNGTETIEEGFYLRLHVGFEYIEDMKQDLEEGFKNLK